MNKVGSLIADKTITLKWDLSGFTFGTGAIAYGMVHIHSGHSCESASAVGTPYYTPITSATPWTSEVAKWSHDDSDGTTGIQSQDLNNGYHLAENNGRTVVIYAADGVTKVGCGVLRPGVRCMTQEPITGRSQSYWTCAFGSELKRKIGTNEYNDLTKVDVLLGDVNSSGPVFCDGSRKQCDKHCCTTNHFCELKDLISVQQWEDSYDDSYDSAYEEEQQQLRRDEIEAMDRRKWKIARQRLNTAEVADQSCRAELAESKRLLTNLPQQPSSRLPDLQPTKPFDQTIINAILFFTSLFSTVFALKIAFSM